MSEKVRNRVIPLIHPLGPNAAVWARTQAKDEQLRVRHQQLIRETRENVCKTLKIAGFDDAAKKEGDTSRTVVAADQSQAMKAS